MRRSITHRLVAMFALGALLTFTLIGTALYGVLQRELTRHQNDDLNTNLQNMRYSIERFGDLEHWARLQVKMDTLSPADGSVRFWVLSDDPRFQYGKGLDEMERVNQGESGHGKLTLPLSGRTYRTLSMRLAPFADRPAVRLIVGVDMAPFDHTMRTFLVALTLLLLGAVAVVMALGWWIARIGLRPLQRLSEEARALRPKTLSQRLQLEQLPVELEALTVAFNGALGRLEDAYQQLEAFNADVAHELRTPLANMIGGAQVALSRPRSAAEFEDTLQSNLEELERLRSIVNDMLFLARADQGEAATGLTAADVAHEVEMTIEFFEPLLDETGATVAIEGDLRIQATMNVALFRRALSNLLQNAIEHSAAGSQLVVTISRRAGAIWIAVANPGETVAAAHLPRLFDRFYRVDSSRHDAGDVRGHGLGLAIVKAVAAMHGGATLATSEAGVTTIAFSLADAAQ
jgi:two-component system, OmpR family, heavy metal sensor histidine kinase CusS